MELGDFYIADYESDPGVAMYCDRCGRAVLAAPAGHIELSAAILAAARHSEEPHGS
jgi:hypothetical protein